MDLNRFYELFTEGWSHIEFEVLEQEDEEIKIEVKNIALARTVFEW